MAKGLHADIFRSADTYDCTNNGITSRARGFKSLVVLGLKNAAVFDAHEGMTVVVQNHYKDYLRAVPCDTDGNPLPGWWMFGGNFIFTNDSRFGGVPIPVHDRQETAEQSRLLSL